MTYDNALLNALLAAVLGVLIVVVWVWAHPAEYKELLILVALGCAVLGYFFGGPFVEVLIKMAV